MRQPACGRRQDRGGIRRGHGAGGARAGHRGGDQAAGGDATGDALSRTSRHLDLLADHVRAGAHVVLRGHLGDAVLLEGKLKDETWAVGKVLVERAGIDTVLTANQADGLRRVAGESSERVGELLAELRGGDETVGLGPSIRVLLKQEEMAVAIVLQSASTLIADGVEQGRETLVTLLEAMTEAELTGDPGDPIRPRNTLVVHGTPTSAGVEQLAALPGVVEQTVEPADRAERLAALGLLAGGFHGAGESPPEERHLEALARVTHGYSLRGLEQLRRRSHAVAIPATRPESLYRAARGERTSTPIDRVGVERIVEMIRDEIVGQDHAVERIAQVLSRGRWRSANRPSGAVVTRPMGTLVLHGPPGVGKTETALLLAEAVLGSRDGIRRIDCSEFQGDHDTARLTGAPPGYVGYEDGGVLSEALQDSAAVIVLDEFDRGPPRLAEMLLGILDAGRLTDGRGRTATFENALLILTTNAGSKRGDYLKSSLAEAPGTEDLLKQSAESLEQLVKSRRIVIDGDPTEGPVRFEGLGSPALWSRLQDSLVGYDILRRDAFDEIVDRACRHLAENLADEYDLRPRFASELFAPVIFEKMPEKWDGRSIFPRAQDFIEVPAREKLEALATELPAGTEVEFEPDPEDDGRATAKVAVAA